MSDAPKTPWNSLDSKNPMTLNFHKTFLILLDTNRIFLSSSAYTHKGSDSDAIIHVKNISKGQWKSQFKKK